MEEDQVLLVNYLKMSWQYGCGLISVTIAYSVIKKQHNCPTDALQHSCRTTRFVIVVILLLKTTGVKQTQF